MWPPYKKWQKFDPLYKIAKIWPPYTRKLTRHTLNGIFETPIQKWHFRDSPNQQNGILETSCTKYGISRPSYSTNWHFRNCTTSWRVTALPADLALETEVPFSVVTTIEYHKHECTCFHKNVPGANAHTDTQTHTQAHTTPSDRVIFFQKPKLKRSMVMNINVAWQSQTYNDVSSEHLGLINHNNSLIGGNRVQFVQ